jgi:hypothetical protein
MAGRFKAFGRVRLISAMGTKPELLREESFYRED